MEERKSLIGNRQVRKFEEKPVSQYPPISTEELMDQTFYILKVAGEINVGQYGPSYVVEVTTEEDTSQGYSWLVNKASVLGRQLEDENKKGARAFPFETRLAERTGNNGRMYITFAPPELPWDKDDSSNLSRPTGVTVKKDSGK